MRFDSAQREEEISDTRDKDALGGDQSPITYLAFPSHLSRTGCSAGNQQTWKRNAIGLIIPRNIEIAKREIIATAI